MLRKTYRINSGDVGPDGLIRVSALQRYMQQLAREDCNGYGATYENMRADNMVFVITRLGLEVYGQMRSDEVITVVTYNNRVEGVHFIREFDIYKGNVKVASASTSWVLINFEKRTILRPKALKYPIISYNRDIHHIEVPKHIFEEGEQTKAAGKRKVVYSDLDENNHLNNCVYSDIALDYAPIDLYNNEITGVLINFTSEARLGDILNISISERENSFCISSFNETAEKVCYEAEIFYKPKAL